MNPHKSHLLNPLDGLHVFRDAWSAGRSFYTFSADHPTPAAALMFSRRFGLLPELLIIDRLNGPENNPAMALFVGPLPDATAEPRPNSREEVQRDNRAPVPCIQIPLWRSP